MAKNLIDDQTFEFKEGAEKESFAALNTIVTEFIQAFNALNVSDRLEAVESLVSSQGRRLTDVESGLSAHTDNSNIHLSQIEKEFLSAPFVSGSYYGNSSLPRTINLGFTPSIVIVIAGDLALAEAVFDGSQNLNTNAYAGVATGIGAGAVNSLGIEIVTNGFKLTYDHLSSSYSHLNDNGIIYGYMAFKQFPG